VRVNPSIRTQLLAWLVIPLLGLLLVGTFLMYKLSSDLATDAYDKSLLDSVYEVSSFVAANESGKIVVDLQPQALKMLKDNPKDKVFYQVLDEKGKIIAGDDELPAPDLNERVDSKSAEFRDDTVNGEDVRIASVNFPVPGQKDQAVFIQVAETMNGRDQIAEEILTGVVVPQLVIIGLSALVVWFGVARGLRPLTSVRDAVASRTPTDLRPIALDNVPKEVRPLVHSINELLDRLREDLQAQRRFVANAAHQLRTPIAGLKTQSELALRQSDPKDIAHALNLINIGAERAARLANQLLALARAEPGAVDPTLWQVLDLNDIAKNASKELVTQALSKNIDLGFEESAAPALVRGDRASLHELASNLIENAVLYTPSGGHVTARIATSLRPPDLEARAFLIVEDDGPGIAADERERVFERFYRVSDREASGSGLGLAIVREIASVHIAEVYLGDGPDKSGTRVTVDFPAVTRNEQNSGPDFHHRSAEKLNAAPMAAGSELKP
jgi:two-component system, OmpR family, sensor histidine kinase TctE